MKQGAINLKKVDKMAGLSFENGLRLHFDSISLFKLRAYPSAFFLSILALEEIGKSFLLMDVLFHSITGRSSEWEKIYLSNFIYSHRRKQASFARHFEMPMPNNKYFQSLYGGEFELLKQNSVYVGLKRYKRKAKLKGKINNPFKTNKFKAQRQITKLNDHLLELALGFIKQTTCVEAESLEKVLTRRLFNKLKKSWPFIHHGTKKKLKQIESVK